MDFKEFGSKLQELASSLCDYIKNLFVPPKSIKEYYNIGSLSISKKLFQMIFYCLVIISVVYLASVVPELISQRLENFESNKIYTKYYNSRALSSYSGLARVISKKNDAKYVGELSEGVATGKGRLYGKNGKLLYDGDFVNNEYSGKGTLYYDDEEKVKYAGDFESNKFEGEGKLYYENGQINYEGAFIAGLKNGEGILFNKLGREIFKGSFSNDHPCIESYLGQEPAALKESFLENGLIYSYDAKTCVIYKSLGVMACLNRLSNSVSNDGVVEQIYILNNEYFNNIGKLNRRELDKVIDNLHGVKDYTGYTRVLFNEMSAIDYLRVNDEDRYKNFSEYEFSNNYQDVFEAVDETSSDKMYVQSYNFNGLRYCFYFSDRDEEYTFYSIERLD